VFITRDLPGNLDTLIRARGFALQSLPRPQAEIPLDPDDRLLTKWAGVPAKLDAAQTGALLVELCPDWLVLDHYAFDATWQAAALPANTRLMVIDDLADRPHLCDVLLDQNLGRQAVDYDGLVPVFARRMIGPSYALLRPEFSAARGNSLAIRAGRKEGMRNILIAFGGVDIANASETALRALAALPKASDLNVELVLGNTAPALDRLRALAPTLPYACTVLVDVHDMAKHMTWADVAIGAAGGTAWERCTLGLPSLIAVLADNQVLAAQALANTNAAILLGRADAPNLKDALRTALARLSDPTELAAMAARAATICDGRGTALVIRALLTPRLQLRPATFRDGETIWHWRSEIKTPVFLRSGETATLPDHLTWFAEALAATDRHLFIAETSGPVGHLRLDDLGAGRARVSIILAPQARGQGLAVPALAALGAEAAALGFVELIAEVHAENAASIRAFATAGFKPRSGEDGFLIFERRL
jgi:UDP-2,4-diacetamido-2,4,6-trideoxy-beta-L-altropyranose hydrolase